MQSSDIKAVLNGVAVSAHKRYNKTSDREKRRLYNMGLNDCEISSALGITPQTVFYWRQKNELPPNRKGAPSARPVASAAVPSGRIHSDQASIK